MRQLADRHPETMRLINLGRSAEGRDVLGLTISEAEEEEREEGNGTKKKKKKKKKKTMRKQGEKLGFVIQGAQHAREVLFDPCSYHFFVYQSHYSGSRQLHLSI